MSLRPNLGFELRLGPLTCGSRVPPHRQVWGSIAFSPQASLQLCQHHPYFKEVWGTGLTSGDVGLLCGAKAEGCCHLGPLPKPVFLGTAGPPAQGHLPLVCAHTGQLMSQGPGPGCPIPHTLPSVRSGLLTGRNWLSPLEKAPSPGLPAGNCCSLLWSGRSLWREGAASCPFQHLWAAPPTPEVRSQQERLSAWWPDGLPEGPQAGRWLWIVKRNGPVRGSVRRLCGREVPSEL